MWGDISLWFLFSFPWWLVMFSIFSCACWYLHIFSGKMSIQVLCPLFNWAVFFNVKVYEFFEYFGWNSLGKNTGVGSLSLLQRMFPTQGSNLGLPHCRRILYQLSQEGIPRILEWVAYHFSSRSSRPRNQTRVSCIAGRFFTNWAIREPPYSLDINPLSNICVASIFSHSISGIFMVSTVSFTVQKLFSLISPTCFKSEFNPI